MARRLAKSRRNRVLFGCLGGIAEFFGWDPTILRIIFVIISLVSAAFPGIMVYLVLMILMPQDF